MKVRASVKRLCESCRIVKRKNVVRVICKNTRHKQRQGWWHLWFTIYDLWFVPRHKRHRRSRIIASRASAMKRATSEPIINR